MRKIRRKERKGDQKRRKDMFKKGMKKKIKKTETEGDPYDIHSYPDSFSTFFSSSSYPSLFFSPISFFFSFFVSFSSYYSLFFLHLSSLQNHLFIPSIFYIFSFRFFSFLLI